MRVALLTVTARVSGVSGEKYSHKSIKIVQDVELKIKIFLKIIQQKRKMQAVQYWLIHTGDFFVISQQRNHEKG